MCFESIIDTIWNIKQKYTKKIPNKDTRKINNIEYTLELYQFKKSYGISLFYNSKLIFIWVENIFESNLYINFGNIGFKN